MTDQIKPEWVGRMAAAQWHYEWPDREFCREPNDLQDFYYESARTGLEAVAPLIAAKALEDAAEACTVTVPDETYTVTIRPGLRYRGPGRIHGGPDDPHRPMGA